VISGADLNFQIHFPYDHARFLLYAVCLWDNKILRGWIPSKSRALKFECAPGPTQLGCGVALNGYKFSCGTVRGYGHVRLDIEGKKLLKIVAFQRRIRKILNTPEAIF
jgi:hypothetical protein